ncbi:MAG: Serine protease AprX [Chlamydiae bacterium]|nr:Serine protease AprX [Chlamydiota bacterium]
MTPIERYAKQPSTMTTLDPTLKDYASLLEEGRDKVSVEARVTDLTRWLKLSEVIPGMNIKVDDKLWLVTGEIPIDRAQYIQDQVFVKSLKASQLVTPMLDQTNNNIGLVQESVKKKDITQEALDHAGEGTLIGVIDFGLDFAHDNFRNNDGTTRLISLWDQNAQSDKDSPVQPGREYTTDDINKALKTKDPYSTLGYKALVDAKGNLIKEAHGTHVMDIAAGSGKVKGIAHKADLIFVQVQGKDKRTSADFVDGNSGFASRIAEAADYIFKKAGNKPCVVNISLGRILGPHDGSSITERIFDSLVRNKPNRAIVIAAGNFYANEIHKSGTVVVNETTDIQMRILKYNFFPTEVEIWYSGKDEFGFELIDPKGKTIANVPLAADRKEMPVSVHGTTKLGVIVDHIKSDPDNGDNFIRLKFAEKSYDWGGTWGVRLRGIKISDGGFHAWIAATGGELRPKFIDSDPDCTLGSFSNGKKSIVVGSYDANEEDQISYFSSSGPTRDGRRKPEVSAPGHDVWAADSTTGNGRCSSRGTSMAAPAVTGFVSRMYGIASKRNISLTIDETREILTDSALKVKQVDSMRWHSQYGFGRVRSKSLSHRRLQSTKLKGSILPVILLGIFCLAKKGYDNQQRGKRKPRYLSFL